MSEQTDTYRSLVSELASETLDWMADAPAGERDDVANEAWAFALATFVDGVAVTPLGYREDRLIDDPDRCIECGVCLETEPEGSTLCLRCFLDG